MDLKWTKVVIMVLTSVIPIFLSLLPLWFKSYLIPSKHHQSPWREVVASVLLCYGGGVLLATSLVHLLPEVLPQLIHYSNTITDEQCFCQRSVRITVFWMWTLSLWQKLFCAVVFS